MRRILVYVIRFMGGDLTPDDMPTEDTRLIADSLGVEVALILMNELSGMTLIIPKNGLNKIKNRYIYENYDGTKKSRLYIRS